MRFVVLDYESFYDDQFTLSRMTTESYIRDSRFRAHGAAIKWSPNHDAKWYDEKDLRYILKQEDWSDVFMIHHHAQFDGLILSHHYNVHPKMFGCTLAMARLLLGNHISISLDSVRKHFGLAPKITPYNLFKGKHWEEMTPAVHQLIADGACDEVESIWQIFCKMMQGEGVASPFPVEELDVVDITVKMFTEPRLRGDINLLADIWEKEARDKAKRLVDLNIDVAELQSSDRFAELLRAEGVEPARKDGGARKDGSVQQIYAFAKTDDFMRDLLDHDSERIKGLAEARLGAKSSILQDRAQRLGEMESRGSLPVYLNYAGAGTLRPSGGDATNFLNLKRGSPIRRTLMAPEGYLLAPVDSSQIECRCLHWLAGGADEPVIQKFRDNEDPYVDLATQFYGETIYKPKFNDPRRAEMEAKRGMGKQGRLMCGYGAAGLKFKITAKNGQYGPPVDIPLEDAERFVALYRDTNPSICGKQGYWAQAGRMLSRLAGGPPTDWGILHVKDHRIYLPNGCPLIYDTLEFYKPQPSEYENYREFERSGFWRVKTRKGWKTMWGSKLVQNICEAVSRVIVTQAMIRLHRMGYRILNHPYDELLMLIPRDGHEDKHLEICLAEMKRDVPWLPGLPLDAEAHMGERYEK